MRNHRIIIRNVGALCNVPGLRSLLREMHQERMQLKRLDRRGAGMVNTAALTSLSFNQ